MNNLSFFTGALVLRGIISPFQIQLLTIMCILAQLPLFTALVVLGVYDTAIKFSCQVFCVCYGVDKMAPEVGLEPARRKVTR